jgi:hypothetical protein
MESKPGLRTTELWLVLAANALVNVGAIDVGAKYRGLLAVLSTVGYTLSRGIAKAGIPAEPTDPSLVGDPYDDGGGGDTP